MSRARPVEFPDGTMVWFDQKRNGAKATAEQIAWLAAAEDLPLDDLLDEGLSQGQVLERLRVILYGTVIPLEIIERRRLAREAALRQPVCRVCPTLGTECEGDITRHHFVPRWLMLKLENYTAYSMRSKCTIPVCIGRHRDLHLPGNMDTPKSIAQFMTRDERLFAQKMLDELFEQHPFTEDWIGAGDPKWAYEAQLVEDYRKGVFAKTDTIVPSSDGGSLAFRGHDLFANVPTYGFKAPAGG